MDKKKAINIPQKEFDELVKKTMDDFSLSEEEAKQDTIEQFQAQGVQIKIIKDVSSDDIINELKKLEELSNNYDKLKILNQLDVIKNKCAEDIRYRIAAGKEGFSTLLNMLNVSDNDVKLKATESLISLVTGYPDVLNVDGVNVIISNLQNGEEDIQSSLIYFLKQCCIKHEGNKITLFDTKLLDILKCILLKEDKKKDTVRVICELLYSLVQDDDIRVEYSAAHERALKIANTFLGVLLKQALDWKDESWVVTSIIRTMCEIIVRNEICETFTKSDGLELISYLLNQENQTELLICYCLKLLKTIAGNDNVKIMVADNVGISTFISILRNYHTSRKVTLQALAVVSVISLRNEKIGKSLCEGNIAEVIVTCMEKHEKDEKILKQGCWAIRNILSRNRDEIAKFIECGVEKVLRNVLDNYSCFEARNTLNLLGCDVTFNEEWKGEGKGIRNE